MSAVSPFLCIMITEPSFQLFGSLPSNDLLNILVNIWTMGSPQSFKTFAVMLSYPGALFRLSCLMAALTSVGRMGGGGVFWVMWICTEGCYSASLVLYRFLKNSSHLLIILSRSWMCVPFSSFNAIMLFLPRHRLVIKSGLALKMLSKSIQARKNTLTIKGP